MAYEHEVSQSGMPPACHVQFQGGEGKNTQPEDLRGPFRKEMLLQ